MSRRSKVFLAIASLLVLGGVGWFVWVLRHPLATFAAARRRTLQKAGFERVELGAGAERLTLFAAGDGPPLVLLHGLGDQAGGWAEVAPSLADRHRVVVVDLPGHGDSAPAEGDLAMATVVAGSERALAWASGSEPATVVGNSLGAWLATILAHRRPELVARLVLINGGALRGEPGGPSLMPTDRAEAAKLMAMLRDPGSPAIPGFVLDDVVRRAATGPIARLSRDAEGLVGHLLDGRLREVGTPTDLLWGASDKVVPLAYAERLLAELPAARLTKVERCGHVPQVECPKTLTGALRSVLDAAPPAAAEPAPPSEEEVPTETTG